VLENTTTRTSGTTSVYYMMLYIYIYIGGIWRTGNKTRKLSECSNISNDKQTTHITMMTFFHKM
jgi:hypothetical protein